MSRPDQPEAVPTALDRPVPRHRHQDPSTLIPSQDWFGHLAIQREPATDDILGVIGTTFLLRPRQQAPDQLVLTDLQIQSDVSSQVKLDGHPVDRSSLLHRAREPIEHIAARVLLRRLERPASHVQHDAVRDQVALPPASGARRW